MSHDHHFLSRLDRVSYQDVDLALELYRDHKLVRFILSGLGLPEAAERVAISLDDPREGPFLVVTREGRFVTCLARRMHVDDLPTSTFEHGIVALAYRGVWAAAKLGKRVLPAYKRLYDVADAPIPFIEALFALAAIGLRHSRLQAEVRKALSSPPKNACPELVSYSKLINKVLDFVFDDTEAVMRACGAVGAEGIVMLADVLPEGSPYRFTRPEDVPP